MVEQVTSSSSYDSEPVKYCANCYSLKIGYEEHLGSECCMNCGCTNILESSIECWDELYSRRYGHKFVVKGTDPRNSPFFKMPLSRLKKMVFESKRWKDIACQLYPAFPKHLNKIDAIMLLFDNLIRDNRIDDLRLLLSKNK